MKIPWLAYLLVFAMAPAEAAVVNVEFVFTPFIGDPATAETVTAVPGTAQVFINGVPLAEQEVDEKEVPVLFDDHQVAPSVWVTMAHVGPMVRKGDNRIRVEFTPRDPATAYGAQLRWASVMDETTTQIKDGGGSATNQANQGVDGRKSLKGKVTFEREFTAPFAIDRPWHHYPAITSLTEDDKLKIAALLKTRAEWFKPDFKDFYKALEANPALSVDDVRKAGCVEAAYKAGVRVPAPSAGELLFATPGGAEVVVTRKAGPLFGLDENTFAAVKDEETQMCVGMALWVVYTIG